jgi:hypothetical protein
MFDPNLIKTTSFTNMEGVYSFVITSLSSDQLTYAISKVQDMLIIIFSAE